MDGRERLDAIVTGRLGEAGVDQGPMFSTVGWRVGGRVFAFVGRDGELIAKLPEPRVRRLVETGAAEPMTLGRRTMREWVHVGAGTDWEPIVLEAFAFVRMGA